MKDFELVQGMQMLGMAYGKEFTQQECELYYEFLREYSYETFKIAIKNIIRTSKFLPKINEIIEACENAKVQTRYEVIEYMNQTGYFKHIREYEKTIQFMERGIIPEWLKNDINTYYKMMINNRLEQSETLMISGGRAR